MILIPDKFLYHPVPYYKTCIFKNRLNAKPIKTQF